MNPSGLYLHICSCQHPGHSICQHKLTYIQEPQAAVVANPSPGSRVDISVQPQGLGTRKGNFCIVRGGHSWGPLSYQLAKGTSWRQGWCWDKEHSIILGGATWSPLTLGTAGPTSYLPHT